MRVKDDEGRNRGEGWGWKGSRAVCLTIRTRKLPSHVCFCNMKLYSQVHGTMATNHRDLPNITRPKVAHKLKLELIVWVTPTGAPRPLSRRVRYCATILRHTGRIAGQRRRPPNIPGVNHSPAAQETVNPRYYGPIYCDTTSGRFRSYVPAPLRLKVFQSFHDLSHRGTKTTAKVVAQLLCGKV
jgi:hypothetical protein